MSTHNLCFGTKIRKIAYPCIPQFHYIKVGFKGVYILWTFSCWPILLTDSTLNMSGLSYTTVFEPPRGKTNNVVSKQF